MDGMMFNSEFNSFPPISFVPKSLMCIVWYLIWLTLSRLTCKSTNLWKQMSVITKFNQVESKTAFLRNALWEENRTYIPVYVFLVTNCMVSKGKQWSIILFELPEVLFCSFRLFNVWITWSPLLQRTESP